MFSSSTTVYGHPANTPITEDFPLSAPNPYGRSKLIVEDMLRDFAKAEPEWRIALLRYFNPIGAHESGDIVEDPNGIPNNLMPFITQVASDKQACLKVFGNDYPTHDGTGVRDYIHVVDLAVGHVKAVQALHGQPGLLTANLGTGKGYSVLDMVKTFERVNEVAVPHEIVARRPGDIAECWANPAAAERLLGWRAEKGLEEMCRDSWRWQSRNTAGFP
ncbi:UDP-glucose 4-epimerase [Chromobacterium vaccinii]|nr:UDP-glucose 4-epimerase [Chromobacterium vaccinii]